MPFPINIGFKLLVNHCISFNIFKYFKQFYNFIFRCIEVKTAVIWLQIIKSHRGQWNASEPANVCFIPKLLMVFLLFLQHRSLHLVKSKQIRPNDITGVDLCVSKANDSRSHGALWATTAPENKANTNDATQEESICFCILRGKSHASCSDHSVSQPAGSCRSHSGKERAIKAHWHSTLISFYSTNTVTYVSKHMWLPWDNFLSLW